MENLVLMSGSKQSFTLDKIVVNSKPYQDLEQYNSKLRMDIAEMSKINKELM